MLVSKRSTREDTVALTYIIHVGSVTQGGRQKRGDSGLGDEETGRASYIEGIRRPSP